MTAERILITGGRVIDPRNGIDAVSPICIADGKIAAVGYQPDGFHPERELHVPGQVVCPGFIDLSARLREPGQSHKGTIESEGAAAIAAGVTTVCVPPDTMPVIDTPAVVKLILERGQQAATVRIVPIGALTRALNGRDLSEMSALQSAGCVAVGNAAVPLGSNLVMRRALEYAASYDLLVLIRPQDASLRDGGCAHEGAVAARLGLPGIPEAAETVAVAEALVMIELTGARAHFGQISSARAASMIANARSQGLRVSADTAMHHLHLTEEDVDGFNALCHVDPPLRTKTDRDTLRAAVAEGSLQALCSDHQPHEPDAKLQVFAATEPGIAALETLLPLGLRLVDDRTFGLPTLIDRLTTGPAAVLGLSSGHIGAGAPADLCIFDPRVDWTIDESTWRSAGRNTPYWGTSMRGRVTATIVGGRLVGLIDTMDDRPMP
jgi:dihydroorotase